jgi:Predicted endonuclease distantly related to archaeal Holliday junction resolvase
MCYTHHDTGKTGEELAIAWLLQNNFSILMRNWRYKRYEMDIIAEKNGVLHFIEVKTRRSQAFGFPEERIDRHKIRRMLRTGTAFQGQYRQWMQVQYDILSIMLLHNQPPEYYFIEDVYL